MKKIKTLFERVIVNHKIVEILPKVAEGCEWVLKEDCVATRKLDGNACAIIGGKLYTRLDLKNTKHGIPDGAIACQEEADKITGSHPYWTPVTEDPRFKWHRKAFESLKEQGLAEDGTYELCGKHIGLNPEQLEEDTLIKHGDIVLDGVIRTFEGIKDYLETHDIEGIVFHRNNGDMAKIKRTDFGFEWRGHVDRDKANANYHERRRKRKNK